MTIPPPTGPLDVARSSIDRSTLTDSASRSALAGVFYLAGAAVVGVAATDPLAGRGLVVVAAAAALFAAATLPLRHRFGYALTVASSALGTVFIATAIILAGGGWGSAAASIIYSFVAVHTGLVLRRRDALLVMGLALVTAVLAGRMVGAAVPVPAAAIVFVLLYGTLLGVTLWLVQRYQQQAMTDGLTGLANRAGFDAALEHARATVERTDEPLSLVALDLDGFKAVNDRDGHAAGDRVLVEAARAWTGALRERDVLARVGGDEFCVVLPGADDEEAGEVAARLVAATPADVGCSAGTARWEPGTPLATLIRAADRSLYADKARRPDVPADGAPEDAGRSRPSDRDR